MSCHFCDAAAVSILEAVAMKLPDVFAAEILPKLGLFDTLNLAQVSKSYNDAVWSVEGVRCMDAKIEAYAEKFGKVFAPSIHCAAEYGNLPALRAHLESGEDVNKREPRLGQTALHIAAYFDRPVTLKALIEAGADVNAQDKSGLHVAVLCRPRRQPDDCHGAHKGGRGCEPREARRRHSPSHGR